MIKKRMTLSLIALIGSAFLFVFASFAWLAVSQIINVGSFQFGVQDVEVSTVLEVSDDGITYVPVEKILFTNSVPGTTKYYRLTLENVGEMPVDSKVLLEGFSDGVSDPGSTYDNTKTLQDMILVSCSNNVNSETIDEVTITSLKSTLDSFYLVSSIHLEPTDVGVIDFTFTISSAAGNDYQNLSLEIDRLMIQSVST